MLLAPAPDIYGHSTRIFDVLTQKKFFLKTYGCQMNLNDSEIVKTLLEDQGMVAVDSEGEAHLILVNTCSIRENAEQKIWTYLNQIKVRNREKLRATSQRTYVGLLGCMAERLKAKVVEEQRAVDLIVGPDAYKDLPRLLDLVMGELNTDNRNYAINTQLSIDETYADIFPVRKNQVSAFITIMRGCSNMCSFCIVPFTRGVERSRSAATIVQEVEQLRDWGVREITLLGQNVNSYLDKSEVTHFTAHQNPEGFGETFKLRNKPGLRFAELLERVAHAAPEVRFRFISPHPKDFPDPVLEAVAAFPNICKSLHMPVQAGNDEVLKRMNRHYTKDAYLRLIDKTRTKIPGVAISTDIIVGFCGETDAQFADTLELVEQVQFESVA